MGRRRKGRDESGRPTYLCGIEALQRRLLTTIGLARMRLEKAGVHEFDVRDQGELVIIHQAGKLVGHGDHRRHKGNDTHAQQAEFDFGILELRPAQLLYVLHHAVPTTTTNTQHSRRKGQRTNSTCWAASSPLVQFLNLHWSMKIHHEHNALRLEVCIRANQHREYRHMVD